MENLGWISLHRKIQNHPDYFSEPFTRIMAWIDIILICNHKPATIYIRGNKVEIKRGQFAWGERSLATRWKWSRGKIRRFLKDLENTQQIVPQKNNILSLYSVINYEQYQQNETTDSTTERPQTDHNNNDNNDNKLITKVIKDKVRDEIVDFILDEFRKRYNFSPIDKKPRQVAYNISQLTKSFINKYGVAYEQKKGEKPDVKTIIKRVFDKYAENEYSQNTQYLDTFKRHLKKILEITGNKLITNS